MWLFTLVNHNEIGQKSLHDVITILVHQLRALGHKAEWNNRYVLTGREHINVMVEGFTPDTIKVVAERHKEGARFIYIATEQPTEKGFNYGPSHEMRERQRLFPEAAQYCEAILCLVPGTAKWYGQFAPAVDIELGYAPGLERRIRYLGQPLVPDHLFGFYGSLSRRRSQILTRLGRKQIAQAQAVRVISNFAEQTHRDKEMARCRVIVQIRMNEAMGLVSSSRCNTALHLGRPVIAEPHELSHPWDQVVHFSKSLDTFYDDCTSMHFAWQALHKKQMIAFKELFSPEAQMGRALREVGLTQRMAA